MRTKKRICLLVAFVLLLATLLMPAVYADDEEYVDWEVSPSGLELYRDGKKYDLYQSTRHFYLDPKAVYVFADEVELPMDESYEYDEALNIKAPKKDAEFVWVSGYSVNYLYVSNSGKAEIDAFLNGTRVNYTIEHENMNADIATSEIQGLDDMSRQPVGAVTIEVSKLEKQERYDVIARDRTYTLAYVHGAIYNIDGQYYYLNYETLGNNYFDADGNFSYRSGSVALTPVDAMTASVISETQKNLQPYSAMYVYEDGYEEPYVYDEDFIAVFWVIFVLMGMIAPIAVFVFGLIMTLTRKKKDGKRWLSITLLAVLWIILAIVLSFVLSI